MFFRVPPQRRHDAGMDESLNLKDLEIYGSIDLSWTVASICDVWYSYELPHAVSRDRVAR